MRENISLTAEGAEERREKQRQRLSSLRFSAFSAVSFSSGSLGKKGNSYVQVSHTAAEEGGSIEHTGDSGAAGS
jgi:hypothetical protein